ncbi:hypothetical protein MJ257_07760 [Paenibacillus timonensis]|uniref:Copper amine oxidase-like N-terminal domain-containing protein n=1 Tax=Paenibacillus timonensis TaxID=225915 RepID=A0ABW3SCL0_9BACL|nr:MULTISPECIES: hypothetical protein [Paenibacillus]MCH1639996.1 hypothetical protein [Paenibacillus timonensis]MDU2241499.1 hypothetical protein [Paenibacillus sp.]
MKLGNIRLRPAVYGVLATTLAWVMTANSVAAAEVEFYHAYTNPETKEAYYNAYLTADDGKSERKVVSRTEDGTWYVLPDTVSELWGDEMSPFVRVWTEGLTPPPFGEVYLDTAGDRLVGKTGYQNSPSGKFGVRKVIYFEGSSKRVALFLKNNQNGVIRQASDGGEWPVTYWLPDGSLLTERYSETAKQNEIVRVNPDTLETHRLLLASLLGYDEQRGELLLAYNEPTRQAHLYDVRSRKVRGVTDQEVEAFYDRIQGSSATKAPEVPDDLEADQLPVKKLEYVQEGEANLTLNGAKIALPFVFFGLDRELYIPVRPVSESLGWEVERSSGSDMKSYRYTVSTGAQSIQLDRTNSKVIGDRLYLHAKALTQLVSDWGIEWVPVK